MINETDLRFEALEEKDIPELTQIMKRAFDEDSRRNHHFYINKCGFHLIKIENPKNQEEASYILEKLMPSESY